MTGSIEIAIIIGVVVLLFGATAIPKLARSLGRAKKEFKKGLSEEADEETDPGESGDRGGGQNGD